MGKIIEDETTKIMLVMIQKLLDAGWVEPDRASTPRFCQEAMQQISLKLDRLDYGFYNPVLEECSVDVTEHQRNGERVIYYHIKWVIRTTRSHEGTFKLVQKRAYW